MNSQGKILIGFIKSYDALDLHAYSKSTIWNSVKPMKKWSFILRFWIRQFGIPYKILFPVIFLSGRNLEKSLNFYSKNEFDSKSRCWNCRDLKKKPTTLSHNDYKSILVTSRFRIPIGFLLFMVLLLRILPLTSCSLCFFF